MTIHPDTIANILKTLIDRDPALANFIILFTMLVASLTVVTQKIVIPLLGTKNGVASHDPTPSNPTDS